MPNPVATPASSRAIVRRARNAHRKLLRALDHARLAASELHAIGAIDLQDHRLRCGADSMRGLCAASYSVALDLAHVLPEAGKADKEGK